MQKGQRRKISLENILQSLPLQSYYTYYNFLELHITITWIFSTFACITEKLRHTFVANLFLAIDLRYCFVRLVY